MLSAGIVTVDAGIGTLKSITKGFASEKGNAVNLIPVKKPTIGIYLAFVIDTRTNAMQS